MTVLPRGGGASALVWVACTLATNIVLATGYPAVQAALVGNGLVVLRGGPIKNTTGSPIAASGLLFTLPAGMAPAAKRAVCVADAAQDTRLLDINTDGTVTLSSLVAYGIPNNSNVSVEGIAFSL